MHSQNTPLQDRAVAYADGQYDVGGDPRDPMCVHFGGDGCWHFSHTHETWGDAEACRDRRRSECVARIMANGGHSEL